MEPSDVYNTFLALLPWSESNRLTPKGPRYRLEHHEIYLIRGVKEKGLARNDLEYIMN